MISAQKHNESKQNKISQRWALVGALCPQINLAWRWEFSVMQNTQKTLRTSAALTSTQIRSGLTVKPDGNIQMRGELAKAIQQDAKLAGVSPGALVNGVLKQMIHDGAEKPPFVESDVVMQFSEDGWSVPNTLFFKDGICTLGNINYNRQTHEHDIEGPFNVISLSESIAWLNVSEGYAGSSFPGDAMTPWYNAIAAALKGAGL